jgi:hypothetical protein
MSIVIEATFKTQVAAAATALTTAWKDSVKTEVAASIKHPKHPLRKIEKLFNFNAATGVVTSDDAYITAAYAGNIPNKGSKVDVVSTIAMALSTATVENAAPTLIILTFAETITKVSNISVGGTAKSITGVSISGAVVTVTVGVAYVNGNSITLSGSFSGNSLNSILLADEVVTNNVT